ncbi:MAG: glutathione S-transferase family protein, partial [Burkholderiales bacterium]
YTFHPVALEKGQHKTPQFLELNRNAQVPVIVDPDGPGGKRITLSQSSAILIYCAEKSGKLMPKDGAARAAMWQALMSGSTDITPTIGSIFAVQRSKEPHPPTAAMFKDRFRQYLKVWDDALGTQKYAAGGEMTIADISLYAGWVRSKGSLPDLCEGLPNLERWAKELAARPAMQRATRF